MKHLIWCVISVAAVTSCSRQKQDTGSIAVSLIHDQTDDMKLKPDYSLLKRIYSFNEWPDRQAAFCATAISDKRLNPTFEAHLSNAEYTEARNESDDVNDRKRNIGAFVERVKTIVSALTDSTNRPRTFDHSECFSTVAKSLTELCNNKSQKRLALIYSDLAENSSFSMYCSGGFQIKDTGRIKARLLELAKLPKSLNGIQVYLLYQPVSREDDQRYFVLSSVYRSLLSERGAEVTVAATNDLNI